MRAEPVFNTFRRQPLRPFYALREFQVGLAILVVLSAVAAWVVWRGAHPDPHLFAVPEKLLADNHLTVYQRPFQPWVEPGSAAATPAAPRLDPFPAAVTADGWRVATPPQTFDDSNLYIKIDGRESFYKNYGFKRLDFLSLAAGGASIDIELYDLGKTENALGAFCGEISDPQTAVTVAPSGLWYISRNSGFVAQGQHYVRLIGSDDNDTVRQKLVSLKDAFLASLPGEPLPWAYGVLVGQLHINPAHIQYAAENAFSFGFADQFYSATVPKSDLEIFVSRRANAAEAGQLAAKLVAGFADFGQKLPGPAPLVHNDYTGQVDGARAHGAYVLGVRFAKSAEEATGWLDKLQAALEQQ